jgi:toxin ParE1/3/4
MTRVDFAEYVKNDIEEIWSYIALDDPEAADRFVRSFKPIYEILAQNRYIGRLRPELREGMRSLPHGRYVVFYFPTEYGVRIYRVLHGARDLKKIFSEESE